MALTSVNAAAYRPFDGTDADVADLYEFELELGPAQYYWNGNERFLIAPAAVLNLGIFNDAELVVDAQDYWRVGEREPGVSRVSLRNDDVLLKYVFREGILQGRSGPSVAMEGGVLTPEVNGALRFGASLSAIASYAWPSLTLHLNECLQYTREQHAELFNGVIAEGPRAWPVRPVAEVAYDRDSSGSRSASLLLGAIWSARDGLAVDLGLRGARLDDGDAAEVRLGLTWAIPLGKSLARHAVTPL